MPTFIITLAEGKKMSMSLDEDDIFIGRVPTINDICISDPSISRQHAHIKRREEGFTIYDLKSLNGVILNGARVSRAVLKDGDEIRLGDVTVHVALEDTSAEESLRAIEDSEQTQAHHKKSSVHDEVTSPAIELKETTKVSHKKKKSK